MLEDLRQLYILSIPHVIAGTSMNFEKCAPESVVSSSKCFFDGKKGVKHV